MANCLKPSGIGGGRLVYVDILRGITMLLVIYSHVCYKLFEAYPESHINNIFVTFRMPLFFFVSGFFMYSDKMNYNLYGKRLLNRFFIQLYPTFLLLAVFCLITSTNYIFALASPFKEGYWFTFVSVEMYVIIGTTILLLNTLKLNNSGKTKILLVIAGVSAVSCVLFRKTCISETSIFEILSIDPLSHFTPYLCLGCIFKIYYKEIMSKYLTLRYLLTAMIVFVFSIIFPKYSLYTLLPAISGIYILHYLCYNLYKLCNSSVLIKRINGVLAKVGTLTLEIYLIHYIILHYTKIYSPDLILIGKKVCNTVLEFPFYMIISILVAFICIAMVKLLKSCRLYRFIFPKKEFIEKISIRVSDLLY